MLFEIGSKLQFDKIRKDILIIENHSKFKYKNRKCISKDDAKILSSDKVNRQLFESEVQLINALGQIKFNEKLWKPTFNIGNSEKLCIKPMSILNVDFHCDSDTKAVTHLSDSIKSTKTNSDLIPHIIEIRKLKFYKCFQEFQQLIGMINKKTELLSNEFCLNLNTDLFDSIDKLKLNFQAITSFTDLQAISRDFFEKLKFQIKLTYLNQRSWIEKFNQNVMQLESEKIVTIRKLISRSSTELTTIGHFAPSDVHRIINNILIEINVSILENKNLYCDLRTKLHMYVIDEYRKSQISFANQFCLWQNAILTSYLEDIKNKLELEVVNVPDTMKLCTIDLETIISRLSDKIRDIFTEIKNEMHPETEKEITICNWNNSFIEIINEFNGNCQLVLNILYKKFEDINQYYLNEINVVKDTIVNRRIFDNCNDCSGTVDTVCLPLLGTFHSSFENNLHKIEIFIDETRSKLEIMIKKIEFFLKELWQLWKMHVSILKNTEDNIYQKLKVNALQHQDQNLIMENDFNGKIDKMRQDSNEQDLKESLKKCSNLLDKIKASYSQFFNQQTHIIKKYPSLVENDVKNFETSIKSYFLKYYPDDQLNNEEKSNIEETEIQDVYSDKIEKNNIIIIGVLEITDTQLLDLFKGIEDKFNIFIQNWYKTVNSNANKIVSVKIDELSSELKLRYHLHEPRYKRIEYDIHNVRSVELTIHSERVYKHSKGIENYLNNILEEYSSLDRENKSKQEQFKDRLVNDEEIYLNITNNSKLLNIKANLEERHVEYMNDIRICLRDFRKNVESKLQTLRQSNANFVRSFKLFSVGGNFCSEEIEEFTKIIEKTNKKIDDMEGEIMSNLENIEKQQHDALIQLQNSFEDKFKYHIIDINFLDKINRAFYNIQLKIKTEVSNSNSQSQIIYENLNYLKKEFYTLSQINLDQKSSILEKILTLFDYVHDRCFYLDCIKAQSIPKLNNNSTECIDGLVSTKVQFCAITILSKGGKQPNEDVGIKTVKTLLQSQNINSLNQYVKSLDNSKNGLPFKTSDKNIGNNKLKDRYDNKNNLHRGNSRSTSIISESTTSGPKIITEKSKLVNKNQRFEKKYLAFGEDNSENNLTFINKIKSFCRETLDGILYASELYYRNKGIRKVTNLNLQDSFDQAAEEIIMKLKFYFKQSEDYYAECLLEFNKQLVELENVINLFPSIMFTNLLNGIISECVQSLEVSDKYQLIIFQKLSERKTCNYSSLRSDLGLPSKEDDLKTICLNEELRQNEEHEEILKSFDNKTVIIFECGKEFVKTISNSTEQFLLLMDNILTTDDIYMPDLKDEAITTNEMIRKRVQIPVDKPIYSKSDQTSNKKILISEDMVDILLASNTNQKSHQNISTPMISAKYTSCHETIMKERSTTIMKFKTFYFENLEKCKIIKEQKLNELANYKNFWNDSIQNLQSL